MMIVPLASLLPLDAIRIHNLDSRAAILRLCNVDAGADA
jgi:hypothetical protein